MSPTRGVAIAGVTGLLLLAAACLAASAEPLVLHVATNGSDQASGSEAAPFRTLARARDAIRAMKRDVRLAEGGVRVAVHGGVHRLEEPFALGPEDSGTPDAPVVYVAAAGERAVLSGGRVIRDLHRNADGSWSTSIAEAKGHNWVFRQLFVDGRRCIPARSPNEGQYFIVRGVPPEEGSGTARDRFAFRRGDIELWPDLSDVELRIWFSWNAGSFPIGGPRDANRDARRTGGLGASEAGDGHLPLHRAEPPRRLRRTRRVAAQPRHR